MKYNDVEILLIEDNDYDAELTTRALAKCGLDKNLIRLIDGEMALEFIFATGKYAFSRDIEIAPKLILLDISMPKVNGIEVLQKIKCSPLTKGIPVVILTSSTLESDIQKCYNLGANSYIVKPLDYTSFALAIENLAHYWLSVNQPPVLSNLYLA